MVAGDMVSFDIEGSRYKPMTVSIPSGMKVYEASTLFGQFNKIANSTFTVQRDGEKTIYIMADSNKNFVFPVRNATA
jgi:hypothetical protein